MNIGITRKLKVKTVINNTLLLILILIVGSASAELPKKLITVPNKINKIFFVENNNLSLIDSKNRVLIVESNGKISDNIQAIFATKYFTITTDGIGFSYTDLNSKKSYKLRFSDKNINMSERLKDLKDSGSTFRAYGMSKNDLFLFEVTSDNKFSFSNYWTIDDGEFKNEKIATLSKSPLKDTTLDNSFDNLRFLTQPILSDELKKIFLLSDNEPVVYVLSVFENYYSINKLKLFSLLNNEDSYSGSKWSLSLFIRGGQHYLSLISAHKKEILIYNYDSELGQANLVKKIGLEPTTFDKFDNSIGKNKNNIFSVPNSIVPLKGNSGLIIYSKGGNYLALLEFSDLLNSFEVNSITQSNHKFFNIEYVHESREHNKILIIDNDLGIRNIYQFIDNSNLFKKSKLTKYNTDSALRQARRYLALLDLFDKGNRDNIELRTAAALKRFQRKFDLKVTGKLNAQTVELLSSEVDITIEDQEERSFRFEYGSRLSDSISKSTDRKFDYDEFFPSRKKDVQGCSYQDLPEKKYWCDGIKLAKVLSIARLQVQEKFEIRLGYLSKNDFNDFDIEGCKVPSYLTKENIDNHAEMRRVVIRPFGEGNKIKKEKTAQIMYKKLSEFTSDANGSGQIISGEVNLHKNNTISFTHRKSTDLWVSLDIDENSWGQGTTSSFLFFMPDEVQSPDNLKGARIIVKSGRVHLRVSPPMPIVDSKGEFLDSYLTPAIGIVEAGQILKINRFVRLKTGVGNRYWASVELLPFQKNQWKIKVDSQKYEPWFYSLEDAQDFLDRVMIPHIRRYKYGLGGGVGKETINYKFEIFESDSPDGEGNRYALFLSLPDKSSYSQLKLILERGKCNSIKAFGNAYLQLLIPDGLDSVVYEDELEISIND